MYVINMQINNKLELCSIEKSVTIYFKTTLVILIKCYTVYF